MTDKSTPQAAPVAAIDSERFEAWARLHFGQGYGFQKEDGTYISAVTRWAAKAFNAGFALAASPQAAPVAAVVAEPSKADMLTLVNKSIAAFGNWPYQYHSCNLKDEEHRANKHARSVALHVIAALTSTAPGAKGDV